MQAPHILTLTTDFGTDGPYVAAVKGVVLGLVPTTQLVDVSHKVTPQNVLEGAFVLGSIIDVFPPGTVHLAVVDPGVGTDRKIIAVRVADQWVVAPDNGLATGALLGRVHQGVWQVSGTQLRRSQVSNTFHGRDIMAPAAAHLLLGRNPDELGPRLEQIIELPNFHARGDEHCILGEVIFRDSFGNLVTNIRHDQLGASPLDSWRVEIATQHINGLSRTYADRPPGSLMALIGSTGWLEVAIVNGDAARHLGVGPGSTVRVQH